MPVVETGDKISASLANGASVDVLLWGATVISWKSAAPGSSEIKERFFVSSKSALDGSKPVRGGIPIIFPFFGPPILEEHKVFPSHGFARAERFLYLGLAFETDSSVSLRFELRPSPAVTAKWPQPFHVEYLVTLSEHELGTKISVTNPATSTTVLKHQALLHNYIAAPASSVLVSPLTGLTFRDKTKGGAESTETREKVDVRNVTDSAYLNAPGTYDVEWEGGGLKIKTTGFPDVVVWNPNEEVGKAIGDLEDKGWEKYVCVEPGFIGTFNEVAPGETWRATQLFIPS